VVKVTRNDFVQTRLPGNRNFDVKFCLMASCETLR